MRHFRFLVTMAVVLSAFVGSAPAFSAFDESEELRDLMMHLQQSLNEGKADQAAGFFTDHAVLVDQCGEVLCGRSAIRERFQNLHTGVQDPELGIFPDKFETLTPDSMLVIGSLTRKEGNASIPVSRLSATLVKQGDKWLIANVAETPLPSTASDNLRALDWLVGSWETAGRKMKADWGPNRNSIRLQFDGNTSELDSCRIAWDPTTKSIISFQFDPDGGFGHSYWTNNAAKKWIVDSTGIAPTGDRTRALGVLLQLGPDEFSWQTSSKSLGAFAVSNKEASTWKRVH